MTFFPVSPTATQPRGDGGGSGWGWTMNLYHPHPDLPPSRGKEAQGLYPIARGVSPQRQGISGIPEKEIKSQPISFTGQSTVEGKTIIRAIVRQLMATIGAAAK